MKYFIVTKRGVFIFCIVLLGLVLLTACVTTTAEQTAAQADKIIPIYCVETSEKKVAITFDAAWGADDTNELISVLGSYNARATFFVVGEWARKYSDSVKAFNTAGHEIANHSNDHTAYSNLSSQQIKEDIRLCNESLSNAIGITPTLVRAPSGDYTNVSETAAKEMEMRTVQWSVDSLDWQGLEKDEIVTRVVNATENGSIILFHNDVKNTPGALKEILDILSQKGFEFVTVSELLYKDNYKIDLTGRQISLKEATA